jgi:hypothetical protein
MDFPSLLTGIALGMATALALMAAADRVRI